MRNAFVAGLALAAAASWYYAADLNRTPVHLYHDEVNFARHAHAMATTGRDVTGNRFPVYFQEPSFSVGRDPVYIYATAAALRVLPWQESTLRAAPVAAALLTIVLVVLIGAELFSSTAAGIAAGLLFALTPALFIHSRQASSVLLPVPFIAWWLLFLLRYLRTGHSSDLALASTGIGLGLYSYLGMAVLLPIYVALTVGAVLWQKTYRQITIVVACLALTAVPFAFWQILHPDRFTEIIASYKLYDPKLDVLRGTKDLLSWFSIGTRVDVYWQSINPGRLFLTGESSPLDSTRTAGTFPLVSLFLWPLGLAAMLRAPLVPRSIVVLVCLATAPLPSVLLGNPNLYRYLGILVFGALLGTAGLWHLWERRAAWARALAVFSVLASLWLFQSFHRFYLEEWPLMASPYQGGNIRGALDAVLLAPPGEAPEQIYLSTRITYIQEYFDLYTRLRRREDLQSRARALDIAHDEWRHPAGPSIAIVGGTDDATIGAVTGASWQAVREIKGLDGRTEFVLFASPRP